MYPAQRLVIAQNGVKEAIWIGAHLLNSPYYGYVLLLRNRIGPFRSCETSTGKGNAMIAIGMMLNKRLTQAVISRIRL